MKVVGRLLMILGAILAPAALIVLRETVLQDREYRYPATGPPLLAVSIVFLPLGLLGSRVLIGAFASWIVLTAIDTYLVMAEALETVKAVKVITTADVIGWTAPQVFVAALCALVGLLIRSVIPRARFLEMRRAREIRTP